MQVLEEKLRAPELRVGDWINSPPLRMADLRGKVVLIDFWDYTCINCIHTLPYLKEWHTRYAGAGLVILGIHAPEFQFSKDVALVKAAVQRFELPYPIALDNDFQTWQAFANRAWPAKYLVDKDGYIRAFHRGEGEYQAFEERIQELLRELNPALSFPEPMAPIQPWDKPGAACYRTTPELYLGYGRGELGNRLGNPPEQAVDYPAPPEEQLPDTVYLEGAWFNAKEYIEAIGHQPARIHLNYQAAGVRLVMHPGERGPVPVSLLLDGNPLPAELWSEDVALSGGRPVIMVDTPRMYALVSQPDFASHRLSLEISAPGLRAYAFTFTTCIA